MTSRTVLVARTDPIESKLSAFSLEDPRDVLAWDLDKIVNQPPSATSATTAVLVCTNARRDQCCALLGRPLAAELAQLSPSLSTQVWETSHLGGHRFAPTLVDLPSGYLFGGPAAQTRSVDACRGRSSLTPPAQAAELAVMRHLAWTHPAPLVVVEDGGNYTVTTPDQSTFRVSVARRTLQPRPESCGKASVPAMSWEATITR